MKPLNVVVAQSDAHSAENLTAILQNHFKLVAVANDLAELRQAIAKNRADIAILDLETSDLTEVGELGREFRDLKIVCTHRLADEQLWSAALAVGAADCVHPADIRSIVLAATGTKIMARTSAA